MVTRHMRRADYVNKIAFVPLFGSSASMLPRELRMLWTVQVSPGGSILKSCKAIYFANKTINPYL